MSDLTLIARIGYNAETDSFNTLYVIADGFEVKNFFWQTGYESLWDATAYAAEMVPTDLVIDYSAAWPCTYVEALAVTMRSLTQAALTLGHSEYKHLSDLCSRFMREYKPLRRAQLDRLPLALAPTTVPAPQRMAGPPQLKVDHTAETAIPAPARVHVPGLAVDPRTLSEDADTEPVAPPRDVRPSRTA